MKSPNWLSEYRKVITSQHGEDGVLEKIFEVIAPKNKWCVEFGAWDGKFYSNTFNLIVNRGWQGVEIEPHAEKFAELKKTYKGFPVVCANSKVEVCGVNSLDNILKNTACPKDFDFLSIDVDGPDYYIWESFVDYNPRVVCVECSPTLRNGEEFIQPILFPRKKYIGTSLASLTKLAKRKGYELISVCAINAFFVTKQLFSLFEIEDNSVSNYKIWALNDKDQLNV